MTYKIGNIECFTLQDIADSLNLHRATIRRYIHSGKLKARKVGKRFLVTEKSLADFLNGKGKQ